MSSLLPTKLADLDETGKPWRPDRRIDPQLVANQRVRGYCASCDFKTDELPLAQARAAFRDHRRNGCPGRA